MSKLIEALKWITKDTILNMLQYSICEFPLLGVII